MSAVIHPVSSITASAWAPAGGTYFLAPGDRIGISDANARNSPVTLRHNYKEDGLGSITGGSYGTPTRLGAPQITIATEGAQLHITGNGYGTGLANVSGSGYATIEMGLAGDGYGNVRSMAGSVTSVDDDFQGNIIVNINGAIITGTKVDGSVVDVNGETISNYMPAGLFTGSNPNGSGYGTPDHYISTGAGDDEIGGSSGIDFLRGGAGNDSINAGSGNDVISGGPGSDLVTLGAGDDAYYLAEHDLKSPTKDTITDFDSNGNDKIQIASSLKEKISLSGISTNEITINYQSDDNENQISTKIASQGGKIDVDDIEFVGIEGLFEFNNPHPLVLDKSSGEIMKLIISGGVTEVQD